MKRIDRDTYRLSTGRILSANHGLIGLSANGSDPYAPNSACGFELSEGYDGHIYARPANDEDRGPDDLATEELIEVAAFMIEQWETVKRFAIERQALEAAHDDKEQAVSDAAWKDASPGHLRWRVDCKTCGGIIVEGEQPIVDCGMQQIMVGTVTPQQFEAHRQTGCTHPLVDSIRVRKPPQRTLYLKTSIAIEAGERDDEPNKALNCGAPFPSGDDFICERPPGHTGDHYNDSVNKTWPRSTAFRHADHPSIQWEQPGNFGLLALLDADGNPIPQKDWPKA